MDELEIRYTTKDIADKLGVEAVTVRKYALALEKAGYNIDRSDGKNRSYSATDVMAFQYMQSIRAQTSITVEEAANLVAHKNNTATAAETDIVRSEGDPLRDQYTAILAAILKKLEESATNTLRLTQEIRQAAPTLPNPEELRLARINDRLTERRVERQLEREALDLWAAIPAKERMRKVGLFRKEEDIEARDRFVRDYVDERYEERIRDAYGISDVNN